MKMMDAATAKLEITKITQLKELSRGVSYSFDELSRAIEANKSKFTEKTKEPNSAKFAAVANSLSKVIASFVNMERTAGVIQSEKVQRVKQEAIAVKNALTQIRELLLTGYFTTADQFTVQIGKELQAYNIRVKALL